MDRDMGCSIVIPAYNEEDGLGDTLTQLKAVLDSAHMDYEIIVVDDGSTDRTAAVASMHDVRLLRHMENRGYGAALKTGIRQAVHDIVIITDADQTYPCEAVPQLLEYADSHDMVVGSRTGDDVQIPVARLPAKKLINALANMMTGRNIPDLKSGLRLFRRSIVERFFAILPDGFSFTTTITLAMLQSNYSVRYVPIDYRKRAGQSKIRPIRDTVRFVFLILRCTVYFAPLRVFVPVSLFLLVLGIAVALISTFVLKRLMDVTTVVILLAALQVAMSGLLADMIDKRTSRL
ncbi:MAG: glycosyltransferase family 2 protein [Chloroflexi bacterium]|nr:glycosyltransferase family 2 protein [Chloroflexota bacterium]